MEHEIVIFVDNYINVHERHERLGSSFVDNNVLQKTDDVLTDSFLSDILLQRATYTKDSDIQSNEPGDWQVRFTEIKCFCILHIIMTQVTK